MGHNYGHTFEVVANPGLKPSSGYASNDLCTFPGWTPHNSPSVIYIIVRMSPHSTTGGTPLYKALSNPFLLPGEPKKKIVPPQLRRGKSSPSPERCKVVQGLELLVLLGSICVLVQGRQSVVTELQLLLATFSSRQTLIWSSRQMLVWSSRSFCSMNRTGVHTGPTPSFWKPQ